MSIGSTIHRRQRKAKTNTKILRILGGHNVYGGTVQYSDEDYRRIRRHVRDLVQALGTSRSVIPTLFQDSHF